MNSFDVFDTLLARRYHTSDPIWHQLTKEFDLPDFYNQRRAADTGSRSFVEIYDYLVAQGQISADIRQALANRELALEVEHSIPIRKNLTRVQHGDLLISDMYLSAPSILQMARSVGLDKQVTIYQSNGDKSNGSIWDRLKDIPPALHLGDNQNSDVTQPRARGIDAELYPGTAFNDYELDLHTAGLEYIPLLSRETRLATAQVENELFTTLSSSLNLPFIFFSAEMLYRKYAGRPIVFLGRDCQLLHKIYNAYYEVAGYLPFSRKVAYDNPALAERYLKQHSNTNTVFVDISSTGGTWQQLPNIDITVLIYSDQVYYTPVKPVLPELFSYITTNTEVGQTNLVLEIFNCGDHGHLDKINEIASGVFTVNFGTPELPTDIVQAIHEPIYQAVELKGIYKDNVRLELSNLSQEELIAYVHYCATSLCVRQDIYSLTRDFMERETNYLNQFTK